MRRLLPVMLLFSAVCLALPAAAHRRDDGFRSASLGEPARIGLYERMQTTGVDGSQVYLDALRGRRVLRHTTTPRVGSFAYFHDDRRGGDLEVAVVTAVFPDGTLELVHQRPDGAQLRFHMNLTRRYTHRAHGDVYNDYVYFTGRTQLAADAFLAFSLPPSPRLVASYRHHAKRDPHHKHGHRAPPVPVVLQDSPAHVHDGECHGGDTFRDAHDDDDHRADHDKSSFRRGRRV